jgi:hypothetical protein
MTWGYPPTTPIEWAQEQTEEGLRREDEQIAAERFAEHVSDENGGTEEMTGATNEVLEGTIEPDEPTEEKTKKRRQRNVTIPAGLIVQQEQPEPETPTTLVRLAVQQNFDIDKLEKLLQLQREWTREEARKAFFAALSNFQSELPPICRSDKVDAGRAGKRRYASLGTINEAIRPYLYANGLSFRFAQRQSPDGIAVTCIVSHRDGHSEETTLTAGADVSGGKNAIQSVGSTITYLERYTLTAALGLTTVEDDDDGEQGAAETVKQALEQQRQSALEIARAATGQPAAAAAPAPTEQPATPRQPITQGQKTEMLGLMRELFPTGAAACTWLLSTAGVNNPAELTETAAMGVLSALNLLKHQKLTPLPLAPAPLEPEQTGRATQKQRDEIRKLTFQLFGPEKGPREQAAWLQGLGYSSPGSLTWMQAADRLATLRGLLAPLTTPDDEIPF